MSADVTKARALLAQWLAEDRDRADASMGQLAAAVDVDRESPRRRYPRPIDSGRCASTDSERNSQRFG